MLNKTFGFAEIVDEEVVAGVDDVGLGLVVLHRLLALCEKLIFAHLTKLVPERVDFRGGESEFEFGDVFHLYVLWVRG